MLGDEIADPDSVESNGGSVRGLGLIRATTRLIPHKTTRLVEARTHSGIPFRGYEIHMGVTAIDDAGSPFAHLENGTRDGIRMPRIFGTYLHGALENRAVLEEILQQKLPDEAGDSKDLPYERLADWFAAHVDQDLFASEYLRR